MSLRNLGPAALVAATVVAVLLVAAPAQSQAPTLKSIFAADNVFTSDGGGSPNVTIAAGGHVNFVYFMGNSRHNVAFTAARPTVCGISDGPAGTTAALPTAPSPPVWEGGCDFDAPGTYPFICELHPSSMRGSVTVVATGASPPAPPPPVIEGPPIELNIDDPAASAPKVSAQQRGFTVRGSLAVARPGSRLLARAFARRKALVAGSRSLRDVQVGRQARSSVGGNRVSFAVPLNSAARRALRRNGRLLITLRLTITPAEGEAFATRRTVILRP